MLCLVRNLLAAGICCWLAVTGIVFAGAGETAMGKQFLDQAQKREANVKAGEAELKAHESWGEAELRAYLRDAAWLVYLALNAYSFDKNNVPDDLQELVSAGYMSTWPANPLNDWQPLRVLGVGDAFAAGELVVQWAPVSHQSLVGTLTDYELRPLSYELGIYGLTPDCEPSGPVEHATLNTWAVTPKGVIVMLGSSTESATQTLDKARKRIARAKAAKEQQ